MVIIAPKSNGWRYNRLMSGVCPTLKPESNGWRYNRLMSGVCPTLKPVVEDNLIVNGTADLDERLDRSESFCNRKFQVGSSIVASQRSVKRVVVNVLINVYRMTRRDILVTDMVVNLML